MSKHLCHAQGCGEAVPPKLFMCRKHWFMLTKALRDRVWATYERGQEITKTPSAAYRAAASECIDYLSRLELA